MLLDFRMTIHPGTKRFYKCKTLGAPSLSCCVGHLQYEPRHAISYACVLCERMSWAYCLTMRCCDAGRSCG
eukprot:scaffold223615_cov17-Prasinocladus_malaysianus.AAC.1